MLDNLRGVVHSQGNPAWVSPNGAHDHRSRVHGHTHGLLASWERSPLGMVELELLPNTPGGQHRPLGMVLLRHRGTKVGEKTIVHEMLDGALIALHCLLRQGEKALPNRIQSLRVHAFGLHHNMRDGTG